MNRLVTITAGIMLLSACGHMAATTRPLYDGPERSAQQVAILSGPVAKVDGVDVSSQAASFALLPGCHVVTLQSQIGEGGVSGAWSADIRKQVYAFRMKAGHSYNVDVRLLPGNHAVGTANVGSVKVMAIERDGQGKKIASVAPARSQADIEACHAWSDREYGQPERDSEHATEEPAAATEEPAAATEEPAATSQEPAAGPAESADASEDPAVPTQEPADASEEPAEGPIDPPTSP